MVETFSFLSDIPTESLIRELERRENVKWCSVRDGGSLSLDVSGPAEVIVAEGNWHVPEETGVAPEVRPADVSTLFTWPECLAS